MSPLTDVFRRAAAKHKIALDAYFASLITAEDRGNFLEAARVIVSLDDEFKRLTKQTRSALKSKPIETAQQEADIQAAVWKSLARVLHVPPPAASSLDPLETAAYVLRKLLVNLISKGLATILIRRLGRGDDFVPDTVEKARLGSIASAISNSGRHNRFMFSPEADRELDELEAFKARETELPTTSPALAQWLEKLPKEFGRLSLISHYVGWYASADCGAIGGSLPPPPQLVSQETARRARRYLTEFVYSHVRVLYRSILTDTDKLDIPHRRRSRSIEPRY